jgi:N-acetylglucosamine kinase-like BadF-type ATPase
MVRTPLVELPAVFRSPQPRADVRYLLGVDGGATKTLAAVLDLETDVMHLGRGGPSNEDAVGARAAMEALVGAADQAMERAGVSEGQLGAAVLAVAGTDTSAIAEHVHAARNESWMVVNDAITAWATATRAKPGVGVISGTGSNVFGVGVDGRSWRAGGWGHLLGDEGSGYWFGAQSIRAALRDRDGSGPPTALSDAVCAFFDVDSVEALASRVYSQPLTKGEIAAFSKELARVAAGGDEVARGLLELGASELASQIIAVIRETGLSGDFPVGLVGGGFASGEMFIDPLARAVREHSPQARVSRVRLAPVGGSVLLAACVCGHAEALSRRELSGLIDVALAR